MRTIGLHINHPMIKKGKYSDITWPSHIIMKDDNQTVEEVAICFESDDHKDAIIWIQRKEALKLAKLIKKQFKFDKI